MAMGPLNSMMEAPKNLSPCTHGICDQILVRASQLNVDHSQPNSVHGNAIDSSIPVNFSSDFNQTRLGTSPPKFPAGNHLLSILRI
jgi:hypothetical protein